MIVIKRHFFSGVVETIYAPDMQLRCTVSIDRRSGDNFVRADTIVVPKDGKLEIYATND